MTLYRQGFCRLGWMMQQQMHQTTEEESRYWYGSIPDQSQKWDQHAGAEAHVLSGATYAHRRPWVCGCTVYNMTGDGRVMDAHLDLRAGPDSLRTRGSVGVGSEVIRGIDWRRLHAGAKRPLPGCCLLCPGRYRERLDTEVARCPMQLSRNAGQPSVECIYQWISSLSLSDPPQCSHRVSDFYAASHLPEH